jgi:acetyl-CoA carboxylase biotin carboxyl carrier protein
MNSAFNFRVPVAIKVAASVTSVSVYNNLLRDPYNIVGGFFLDGLAAGTGAAHEISLDHTGHPIVSKVRDCYLAAVHQGRQGEIPLFAGGGLGKSGCLAADAFKMICLGANGVFTGRLLLEIAGCIGNDTGKCNACNSGHCPSGIATQDSCLTKRLDIDEVAQKLVNYFVATDVELKKQMDAKNPPKAPIQAAIPFLAQSDYDSISQLVDKISGLNFSQVTIQHAGSTISINASGVTAGALVAAPVAAPAAPAPAGTAAPAPAAAPKAAAPAAAPAGPSINAPLNGTFYRSPGPGKPEFCQEGDELAEGATVCIVEAMKLFNPIKAPYRCKVVKLLIPHGTPVKKDDPMISIQKL